MTPNPRRASSSPSFLAIEHASLLLPEVERLNAMVSALDGCLHALQTFSTLRARIEPPPHDPFATVPAACECIGASATHLTSLVAEATAAVARLSAEKPGDFMLTVNLEALRRSVALSTRIPRDYFTAVLETPGLSNALRKTLEGVQALLDEVPSPL